MIDKKIEKYLLSEMFSTANQDIFDIKKICKKKIELCKRMREQSGVLTNEAISGTIQAYSGILKDYKTVLVELKRNYKEM